MKRTAQFVSLFGLLALSSYGVARPVDPEYSAPQLFNLGNSYARAGKPGMAVLNYERNKLIAPFDADVEQNLNIVRSAAQLPTYSANRFERIARLAAPQVMAWLGVLGVAFIAASLLARAGRARRLRWFGILCGVALVGLTVCNAMVLWPTLHEGVVISAATPVRVSPAPLGDSIFQLPEAAAVRILAQHEGFVLVQAGDGRSGWVARSNVAAVAPRSDAAL